METSNQRAALVFGVLLITLGALALAGQLFDIFNWGDWWPLINVAIGLLFFVGMFLGGKATGPLAIPGTIFTTVGLILFFQNLTGAWETWSYAWGLIVASVGVGIYIYGAWSDRQGDREAGRSLATIGLILFLIFGMIFEVLFSVLNISSTSGTIFFPLALALVGLYLLISRIVRLVRSPEKVKGDDRDLFWPILFIGVGSLWTLAILGLVPAGQLAGLLNLWPVLLIVIGVDIATGRRFLWIGALLGALVVGGMLALVLFGNQLGWQGRSPNWLQGMHRSNAAIVSERVDGGGEVVSETRPVEGFSRVRFGAIGQVEVVQGATESLTISGEANLLPYITTEVRGDWLVIDVQPNVSINPTSPIRYQLSVIDLEELEVPGAGQVSMNGLTADTLGLESPGAGEINLMDLQARSLDASLDGAGQITVGGEVETLQVEIGGAGSFNGADLKATTADIEISGAGSASVWVTDDLDVTITGLGSVQYYGNPAVTKKITGLGSVVSKGEK